MLVKRESAKGVSLRKLIAASIVVALLFQGLLMATVYAVGPPDLQQQIFVHYAKPSKPQPPTSDTGSYKLMGAKWQMLPVNLEVNPTNPDRVDASFVVDAITTAADEWDDGAYSKTITGDTWKGVTVNLFGQVTPTTKSYNDLAWTSSKLDGKNTIVFGNYPTSGVIAVTIIWYSRATKAITEFDMVLDTDFTWGNGATNNVMDIQNIATHELGHGFGLNDLYQSGAQLETMYGYATEGETIKRDLYVGDQTGITKLYG
jgi:hypothetical protein